MTQLPHMPDLSSSRPGLHLTPWWQWLLLSAMTAGAILAAVVFSRQSGHIAANEATAHQVEAISDEVKSVKGEVVYLRAFVDTVKDDAEANARRIEQVQEQASDRADAGDARDDADEARRDAGTDNP